MGMPCVTTQKRLHARERMTIQIQIPHPNQAKAEFSTPRDQVTVSYPKFQKEARKRAGSQV